METPEAEARLMNSMKKGNLQSVTFSGVDGDAKKYIEAVPQYKNINIYNEEGKKQFIPHEKAESQTGAISIPTDRLELDGQRKGGCLDNCRIK